MKWNLVCKLKNELKFHILFLCAFFNLIYLYFNLKIKFHKENSTNLYHLYCFCNTYFHFYFDFLNWNLTFHFSCFLLCILVVYLLYICTFNFNIPIMNYHLIILSANIKVKEKPRFSRGLNICQIKIF